MKNDTIDLYRVQYGATEAYVVGVEASKRLCKALERADPYGGIPFSKKRSVRVSEALELMAEDSARMALDHANVVGDIASFLSEVKSND